MHTNRPKVIIITGPTAVGKTGVGLDVALALNGEVISADSVQVYRGLDVGSDKLPLSERKGVPHHLIDVLDVHEDYSAGQFHDDARRVMRDIISRGRTPIVVGGTGFYLRFLQEGKPKADKATPEAVRAVKQEIQKVWEAAAEQLGLEGGVDGLSAAQKWDSAVKLLGTWGDPDAMHKISQERNNYYRLERALVVNKLTGRKRADVDIGAQGQRDADEHASSCCEASTRDQEHQDFDFRPFFLHRERELLYRRCNARVADMVLGLGLLDEAAMLLSRGVSSGDGAAPGSMAGKAVGYRQAIEWMLQMAAADSVTREDVVALVDAICFNTHKLVRHQMTWFRDNGTYMWINMDELDEVAAKGSGQLSSKDAAVAMILEHAGRPHHEGGCPSESGRLDKQQINCQKTMQNSPFQYLFAAANATITAAAKQQKQQQKARNKAQHYAQQQQQQQEQGNGAGQSMIEHKGQNICSRAAESAFERVANGTAGASGPVNKGLNTPATGRIDLGSSGNHTSSTRGSKEAASVGQGTPQFMGRSAEQLLAQVDAAAAHVSGVLLPQLRLNAQFQELLARAQAEWERERVQQAMKAEERELERRKKAEERGQERRRKEEERRKQEQTSV